MSLWAAAGAGQSKATSKPSPHISETLKPLTISRAPQRPVPGPWWREPDAACAWLWPAPSALCSSQALREQGRSGLQGVAPAAVPVHQHHDEQRVRPDRPGEGRQALLAPQMRPRPRVAAGLRASWERAGPRVMRSQHLGGRPRIGAWPWGPLL